MVGRIAVKRSLGLTAGLAMVGLLGGCGAGSSGFEPQSSTKGVSLGNLLAFNSLTAPSAAKPLDMEEKPTCPDIEVLDGTAASRVYAAGGETNTNVKYQFSLGDVVRECSHVGNDLVLKVGVEGRALLGPAGQPGGFAAPIRVAIKDERSGKAVASKLYQVPVTIAGADTSAPFSIVTEPIAVPFVSTAANNDYTVLVGFDPKNTGTLDGKAKTGGRRKHRGETTDAASR